MLAVFGRCFDFHSPQKKKMRLNSGALVEAVNSFAFSNNFKTKSDFIRICVCKPTICLVYLREKANTKEIPFLLQ